MIFRNILFSVLFFGLIISKEKLFLSHPIKQQSFATEKYQYRDSLKVLALMVQFQTDSISETTGNGKFDLTKSMSKIIDPPPHDETYFLKHLIFAKNYFQKVSDDKLIISSSVLPKVVTVSKNIKDYSPSINKNGMVDLINESWKLADSLNSNFNFSDYDLFVIFHAGVGQDIDLKSLYGYNPTPYDLPSLYFSLGSFKNILGSSFEGIRVGKNNFKITNTSLLPETESRELSSFGGKYLLQLSINGILVSSIGSFLGLPDLFDTETGSSAIGRFGLMDGASIFSQQGVSPPEPNAWEKYFLGWVSPKIIFLKDTSLIINAVDKTKNDEIYKIPINSKEYFLIENRNRDFDKNGLKFKTFINGNEEIKNYRYDDEILNDSIAFAGIITDFETPDWNLPGYISSTKNYDGGILIWHIDENIIDANLSQNKINVNKNFRGVDLEEADGSQDIGESYSFTSAGYGNEYGTPFDFWFSDNPIPIYKNTFSSISNPNSLSNNFTKSGIALKNITKSGAEMSFTLSAETSSNTILNFEKYNFKISNLISFDLNSDSKNEILFTSGDSIFVLDENLLSFSNAKLISAIGGKYGITFGINIIPNQKNVYKIIGAKDKELVIISDSIYTYSVNSNIIYPPVINSKNEILIVTEFGLYKFVNNNFELIRTSFNPTAIAVNPFNDELILSNESIIHFGNDKFTSFDNRKIVKTNFSFYLNNNVKNYFGIVYLNDKSIQIVNYNGVEIEKIDLNLIAENSSFAFCDFDLNGEPDVAVSDKNSLKIFNKRGALISNFPFKTFEGNEINNIEYVLKNEKDEQILFFTNKNGQLFAINNLGKTIESFPIQIGKSELNPVFINQNLFCFTTDSVLSKWNIENTFSGYQVIWVGKYADYRNSNIFYSNTKKIIRSEKMLPKNLVYNYPNPVFQNQTTIRYFLNEDAKIIIKIFTQDGNLISTFNQTGFGNLDNEFKLDVSKYQTGVYIAQIEALTNSKTEIERIKIAVIK